MIGKLFDINAGGIIIPKADCYIIQPIKAVIDAYPDKHLKIIAFLHYMNSMRKDDNPYADVDLNIRGEQIISDLKLEIDPENPIIKAALICVSEKYYTTFYGIYKGFKSMLDKIGAKLLTEEIDFSKEGNSANVKSWMKDYEALRGSFKKAYSDFEEEQGGMKVRGGGELAQDEDDDY
jgi:hypothetical protein